MLGSILAETGAAQQISDSLIRIFGVKRAKLALVVTGFSVGLAMFYNAGFVILIPLAFLMAARTGLPLVYLGVAMASSLSVTHGFLPPHPGPTAIVGIFKADMGKTLLLGICAAIPAIICSGIIFPEFVKKIMGNPPPGLVQINTLPADKLPPFSSSFLVAIAPVILMALKTILDFIVPIENPSWIPSRLMYILDQIGLTNKDSNLCKTINFMGDPSVSMLLSMLIAIVFLGDIFNKDYKTKVENLMTKSGSAVSGATMIILIIAAGGAFKQVLTDSGIGKDIASLVTGTGFPPLVLGWLVATMVRISIGSATVAGLMAAGIVQPLLGSDPSVSPELMVLSIGAGSLMCSHVNDTGFWMFKEYFGLSLVDTFKTWTLMETIVGIVGLISVLILDVFV
jgi:gluconate transporter